MSFSVPRRKVAALALASTGLAVVLAGAFAPAASASSTAPRVAGASAAKSDWFVDPRTPAQRKAQIAVPKKPSAYDGKLRETRATYRTKAGSLAVPMRFAFGNTVKKGQAVTLDGNGLFVVNTTTLTASAKSQIRQLAVALDDASSVRCEGYADYAGAAKRNNQLARDRAANVCDYLVSINEGLKVTTVGYGPTWPAVVGGDSEARRLNRRVVVEMTGTKPAGPVAPQATVPGAPILENLNGYSSSVYFAWSAPTDDGGSPITGYQASTGSGWVPVRMQPARQATKASRCRGGCADYLYGYLTDLTPGSLVNLRVRAVNAIGAGAPSNTLSTQVYDVPGVPTSFDVATNGTSMAVHFDAPATTGGLPVTGYEISYDGGLTYDDADISGAGPWTVVASDFELGETYGVRVRARNDLGWGQPASADVLVATKPSAPELGEYDLDGDTLTFAFAEPESDGGLPVTSYEASLDGGDTWQVVTPAQVVDGPLTFTLDDLTYGSTYDVRLRAVNAKGKSPWSNQVSALVSTVPAAPTAVTATVDGTSVSLAFAAPTFTGGTPITGYEVRTDDGDWEPVSTSGASPYTVELTGQATGFHTYAVRAVNARGESVGADSNEIEVTVVPAPVMSHGYTFGNGSYWAYWNVGGVDPDDIVGWQLSVNGGAWLTVSVNGTSDGDFSGTASDPGCTTTGSVCPATTTGRVRAVLASGYSEPSDSAMIVFWD